MPIEFKNKHRLRFGDHKRFHTPIKAMDDPNLTPLCL